MLDISLIGLIDFSLITINGFVGLIGLIGFIGHIGLIGHNGLFGFGLDDHNGFVDIFSLVGIDFVGLKCLIGQFSLINSLALSNHWPISIIGIVGFGLIALSASAVLLAHRPCNFTAATRQVGPVGCISPNSFNSVSSLFGLISLSLINSLSLISLVGLIGLIGLGNTGIIGFIGHNGLNGHNGLVGIFSLLGQVSQAGLNGLVGLNGHIRHIGVSGHNGLFGFGLVEHTGLIGLFSFISLNGLIGFIGLDGLVGPVGLIIGHISLVKIVGFIGLISLTGHIGHNSLIGNVIVVSLGLVAVSLGNFRIKFEIKTKLSPCYSLARESWLRCVRRVFSSLAGLDSVFGDALQNAKQLFSTRIPQMTKYCDMKECENILCGYLYHGDLVFVILKGISIFKFPERFLEISSRDLTSFLLQLI
jgi:hypothetical protein